MRRRRITLLLMIAAVVYVAFSLRNAYEKELDSVFVASRKIPAGITFSELAASLGVATSDRHLLVEEVKPVYDLAEIAAGRMMHFYFERQNWQLAKILYDIDTQTSLTIARSGIDTWQAATSAIPYKVRQKKISGVITSSLYQTVLSQNIDQRFALALAEMFAWQIDFAADIRNGDRFKAIYEERYLDGRYIMPGKILAGGFVNGGETFRGFYFEGSATPSGHYDEKGNSLQRVFLKSPLQYKYISSGFTYRRVNPVTGAVTPHRGIDYVAPYGTPAVAVGDGKVVQAGWNGAYGVSTTVRHNETYTTVYGHFQSLARGIRIGAKVKQGQVVGYVGSTGQATGPHLHYEMIKFGALVNPYRVEIPPGKPVAEADRPEFESAKEMYEKALAAL